MSKTKPTDEQIAEAKAAKAKAKEGAAQKSDAKHLKEEKPSVVRLRDHYRNALLPRVDKLGIKRVQIEVLEALLRLRQAACHTALIDHQRAEEHSAKLDVLAFARSEIARPLRRPGDVEAHVEPLERGARPNPSTRVAGSEAPSQQPHLLQERLIPRVIYGQ